MRQGDRVATPHGLGTVLFLRLKAPDFVNPASVSVVLDDAQGRPGYASTIMHPADLKVIPKKASTK